VPFPSGHHGRMERLDFHDLSTDSSAFMAVRVVDGTIAIGFGIESDGDLDLAVSQEDARRIGQALLGVAG
jgi:hypothetical protein